MVMLMLFQRRPNPETTMTYVAQVENPNTGQTVLLRADTDAELEAMLDAELEETVAP